MTRFPGRIERRNAQFQQWQSLLTNRTKRRRAGEMIIQGVRPLNQALAAGVQIRAVLTTEHGKHSAWARRILDESSAPVVHLAPDLLAELAERDSTAPELLAVARIPVPDPASLRSGPGHLVVVFDRPSTPGNIGTLVRTADALGADGLIVTGHAADLWDPAAVRAGTGSHFALPLLTMASHRDVLDLFSAPHPIGPWQVVGLDEAGARQISHVDLTGPTVLVVGNETTGMSAGWREACGTIAEIPMGGAASSLNAAVAGSIALYEVRRQRSTAA